MINQERVREMTRMSMLEAGIGEKELNISVYRKADYVILQLIKGFIAGTICFAAFFLLWIFWKWDNLNYYFADADFEGFALKVLIRYGIFIVLYMILSGVAAAKRHKDCKQREYQYLRYLHRLNKSYSLEEDEKKVDWR